MRVFVFALALSACSPAPPAPRLVGVDAPELRHICSITNQDAIVYTTHDGQELDPIATGHACDYALWRRDVADERERYRALD